MTPTRRLPIFRTSVITSEPTGQISTLPSAVDHYTITALVSTPKGFIERADALGARRLNLLTETLSGPDNTATIFFAIDELGKACNEPEKAAAAAQSLHKILDEIPKYPDRVPALIVIGV